MTDLAKALAAVGESAPGRPKLDDQLNVGHHGGIGPFDDGFDTRALANAWQNRAAQLNGHVAVLESLALRLAVRLAELEGNRALSTVKIVPCTRCKGRGWFRGGHAEDDFEITCNDCKGTGKEQPR